MIEVGTKFLFEKPSNDCFVQTRGGEVVKLRENCVFVKVRDSFADRLAGRSMFRLDKQVVEYDCSSILSRLIKL